MHTPGPLEGATTASAHRTRARVRGSRLRLLQHGSSRQHKTWNAKLAVVQLKRCSVKHSEFSAADQLMGVL